MTEQHTPEGTGRSNAAKRNRRCNRQVIFIIIVANAAFFVYFYYSSFVISHTDYATLQARRPPLFLSHSVSSENSTDVYESSSLHSGDVTHSPSWTSADVKNNSRTRTSVNVTHSRPPTSPAVTHSPRPSSRQPEQVTQSSSQGGLKSTTSEALTRAPVTSNVTVVTAFLDIGEFGKGSPGKKRDWHIYQQWASAYSKLQAPVVMYTNSDSFADFFKDTVRRHLANLTRVVRVRKSQIWAFSLKPQIAAIYAAGYPRHWPNTVYPEYTCVTHAKFDLMLDTILKGYFPSRLIAWMDIGYLRNIVGGSASDRYVMYPPSYFDPRRVMCGQVFAPNFNQEWRTILHHNKNWVAGGFFLTTRDVMTSFIKQYRRAVLAFLRLRESQVEQHILYATYTTQGRNIVKPSVELQAIQGDWFYSGFSCLHLLPTSTLPPVTPRPTTTAAAAVTITRTTLTTTTTKTATAKAKQLRKRSPVGNRLIAPGNN